MRYSYQFLCVLFIAHSAQSFAKVNALTTRLYKKLICAKNEYLEIFEIILWFPLFANLYLEREKQNMRKLVRITCVDISGSIDKSGLSRQSNRSTLVLFHFFPMQYYLLYLFCIFSLLVYYSMIS